MKPSQKNLCFHEKYWWRMNEWIRSSWGYWCLSFKPKINLLHHGQCPLDLLQHTSAFLSICHSMLIFMSPPINFCSRRTHSVISTSSTLFQRQGHHDLDVPTTEETSKTTIQFLGNLNFLNFKGSDSIDLYTCLRIVNRLFMVLFF